MKIDKNITRDENELIEKVMQCASGKLIPTHIPLFEVKSYAVICHYFLSFSSQFLNASYFFERINVIAGVWKASSSCYPELLEVGISSLLRELEHA